VWPVVGGPPVTARSAARGRRRPLLSLCFLFLVLFPSPPKPRGPGSGNTAHGGLEKMAAAAPLAPLPARAPLRVSAPPSSGSAVVPDPRDGGARRPCSASVRAVRAQGGTGGGGDGEVGVQQVDPLTRPLPFRSRVSVRVSDRIFVLLFDSRSSSFSFFSTRD
jgi:hypothetical protein